MGKSWCFFLVGILVLSSVCALSSTLKPSYEEQETVIVAIKGVLLEPLSSSQVQFRKGHVAIALEYGVRRVGNEYYVWFISPSSVGNYTLSLQNVLTSVNGVEKRVTFEQNYSVSSTLASYYVKPGALVTTGSFDVQVVVQGDDALSLPISFPYQHTEILGAGSNFVSFDLGGVEQSIITNLSMGIYSIPLQIIIPQSSEGASNETMNETMNETSGNGTIMNSTALNQTGNGSLSGEGVVQQRVFIRPDRLFLSRSPTYFYVLNNGSEKARTLQIIYNERLFRLTPSEVFDLLPGEEKQLQLEYIGGGSLDTNISLFSNESFVLIPVAINLSDEDVNESTFFDGENAGGGNASVVKKSKKKCAEIAGGRVCATTESCSGTSIEASDGLCCTASCVVTKTEESSKTWIGYLIAGILLLIILIVIVKYRKTGAGTRNQAFASRVAGAERALP
ncbi:MAG TPA: hypothetical protein VJK51_00235 [Candidatus Nanoarchaeia archaeon]|nr:hypothetical protein [Candidatus Nanoarchaeia archaeon]